MDAVNLPPLPDRMAANLDKHAAQELAEKGRCHEAFVCGYGVEGDLHLWNADQMREYARAAVLQERERAARVCEVWAAEDSADSCLLEVAADIRKGG